jgi:hypothetical protein
MIVQPHAGGHQRRGGQAPKGDPRLFSDPAMGDRQRQEQHDPEQSCRGADPSQHSATNDIAKRRTAGRGRSEGDARNGAVV